MQREQEIIQWGKDRNILGETGEGTPLGQWQKTIEECVELNEAIINEDIPAIRDAIGDVIVCLVMQAYMHHLDIDNCVEAAWNEIKDRKGRMQNGIFVKET